MFASTCSNYGKLDDPNAFATEDWPLRPVSLYAETKVEAELDILEQCGDGLDRCLRFATVYGVSPRMRFDLTVNEFTRDVVLAGDLVVYGEQFWRPTSTCGTRRVRCSPCSMRRRSRSPERCTTWERTREYASSTSSSSFASAFRPAEIQFVKKDEDPRDYRVSFDRIERLGFRAVRTVLEGIDEVIALLRSGLLDDLYAGIYRN